jgi:DNA-binding CsgD family transcriptional regulator
VQVLCLAAAGHSNREIGVRLCLSVHTVVRHMTAMLAKSGESNRVGLVTAAYRAGILTPGEEGPRPTGRRCLPV